MTAIFYNFLVSQTAIFYIQDTTHNAEIVPTLLYVAVVENRQRYADFIEVAVMGHPLTLLFK